MALNQLDLEVEKGSVFGILGPNGSGKTTTLGILLDVVRPNSGSFSWFGKKPEKEDRRRIGAILEVPIFYPYLTGLKNLELIARIKCLPYDDIDEVLEIVGLTERKNTRFRTYSLGMKQRLAIAAALLGKPEVLILDEPTNGLDPKGIAEIRNLIIKIASQGITILLASHILDEVQKICSHVAVLEKGRKLSEGRVNDVLSDSNWVELSADNMEKLFLLLKESGLFTAIQEDADKYSARLEKPIDMSELNKWFFDKGIVLSHLTMKKKSLENYFLELLDK